MHRRALLLALLAASCTSPPPILFTMQTIPGTPAGGAPRRIALRRIGLAGYLDRNSIVRADLGTRLDVTNNEQWAEPLGDMLGRVLIGELNQRLPGSLVFSTTGAITATPDATVEVDVNRLNADASGLVHLTAQVAVERSNSHAPAAARTLDFTARPTEPQTSALVAAMSNAVAQLADAIAQMLRSG